MRSYLTVALIGGCAVTGALMAAPATAADWHSPHIYRETNGSWTNVEYDDGICHYKYSHNAEDAETHLNRWGDCSRVAIGPNGEAMAAAPAVVVPVEPDDD